MDIDVRAARVALANAINCIPGLAAHARWPGALNPPAAVVYRRETRYDPAFDIGADVTLGVRLYLSIANDTGSQDKLDDFLAPAGTLSVPATIYADPTLDGTVDFVKVTEAEAEGVVDYNGIRYISADLVVEVG